MAKTCALCDKKRSVGHNRKLLRGHYNITSKRTFKPNLQKTKVDGKSVLACVRCMRSIVKEAK